MENKDILKITANDGIEKTFSILFTFDLDETGKSYVVYTDYSKDEKGDIKVFASTYDPNQENPKLENIETEEELNIINTYLKKLNKEN